MHSEVHRLHADLYSMCKHIHAHVRVDADYRGRLFTSIQAYIFRGPKDYINSRMLRMISGIPFIMDLRTRMQDPHVYVVFGPPTLVRAPCEAPESRLSRPATTGFFVRTRWSALNQVSRGQVSKILQEVPSYRIDSMV